MKQGQDMHLLVESLTKGLGLEPADLDLFEMALEQEFAGRVAKSIDWFRRDPDRLLLELKEHLEDLQWLEKYFLEREEYERCRVLVQQQALVRAQFPKHFSQTK